MYYHQRSTIDLVLIMQESESLETKKKEKKKVRGGRKLGRYEKRTKKIEGTVSGQASHWQPEVLSKVSNYCCVKTGRFLYTDKKL